MERICNSSTDEVILEWLRAELYSSRFSGDLKTSLQKAGQHEAIITQGNIENQAENEARLQILKGYSWLDFDLYQYNWYRVSLNQHEVKELRYIDYSYWNELTNNTRRIGKAVRNIINGKIIFDVPNDRFYEMAQDFESGKEVPPIIMISGQDSEPPEVIEGHLRATGYALARNINHPLQAILGEAIE